MSHKTVGDARHTQSALLHADQERIMTTQEQFSERQRLDTLATFNGDSKHAFFNRIDSSKDEMGLSLDNQKSLTQGRSPRMSSFPYQSQTSLNRAKHHIIKSNTIVEDFKNQRTYTPNYVYQDRGYYLQQNETTPLSKSKSSVIT